MELKSRSAAENRRIFCDRGCSSQEIMRLKQHLSKPAPGSALRLRYNERRFGRS
jgi:hypothetical protein